MAPFSQEMRALYDRAQRECDGYRPTLFLREVSSHGPLEAAKRLLSTGDQVQTGLYRLAECGSLDISMECLVLRYSTLFSAEEVDTARTRLMDIVEARPDLYPDFPSVFRPARQGREIL